MKKYIHIGYPKNFSTSLQRDYFAVHSELMHLGIGVGGNLGYSDAIVEKALEVYLKSSKEYHYHQVRSQIKDHFQELFNADFGKKAIGISSEHLSFSFSYDSISTPEKARRLKDIFDSETSIILIVRNQFDLIKSLYRESVRVGFAGSFSDYIDLLYRYQDRNFIYDLRYDLVYETFSNLFGQENIHVLFFENYRVGDKLMLDDNNNILLLSHLDNILGISHHDMEFGHFNVAIPSNKLEQLTELNKKYPHGLGQNLFETAEKHRMLKYLEVDLELDPEEINLYSDVKTKRKLISEVKQMPPGKDMSYNCSNKVSSWMREFYVNGNKNLSSMLESKVPEAYFEMKF